MAIHFLNTFTCSARFPRRWHCGTLSLLIEANQGLVLVDTGLGTEDYLQHSGILRTFQVITVVPLNPEEAAVRQVARLGFKPDDVRHIVLTHMHFDHCGGLPDFPHARVHLHRIEYQAFMGRPRQFADLAYVRRHIAHGPDLVLYDGTDERWFDFDAIHLPIEPEMWLVPLPGHTRGLCGLAVKTPGGWLFNVSDAAAFFNEEAPDWLIKAALGPHQPRLGAFAKAHPEVQLVTGHNWLEWFEKNQHA